MIAHQQQPSPRAAASPSSIEALIPFRDDIHANINWQQLCQQSHKERRRPLQSWHDAFFETVFVPHDFSTVEAAVSYCNQEFARAAAVAAASTDSMTKTSKRMTIWLQRQQRYQLKEPLVLKVAGHKASLTMDTWVSDDDLDALLENDFEEGKLHHLYQATLAYDTHQANQPLLHLQCGTLDVKNVRLEHCSPVGHLPHLYPLQPHQPHHSRNAVLLMEPDDSCRSHTTTTTSRERLPPLTSLSSSASHHQDHWDDGILQNCSSTMDASPCGVSDMHPSSSSQPELPKHDDGVHMQVLLENVTLISYSGRGILNKTGDSKQSRVTMENSHIVKHIW